jgi:cysteine synthase A
MNVTIHEAPRDRAIEPSARRNAVRLFAERRVRLPTFAELADPSRIAPEVTAELAAIDPDAPHARNLFRVHWHNDASRRGLVSVPDHVLLPPSVTGVPSPIVVLLGDRFPMIGAHKVLAAYACLAPRIATGRFDPTRQRALWPSTGNYCRGGVAISRILGCRGVAILPEEMSAERFEWLGRWVSSPDDVVKTKGSESNVKEIYDACADLGRDPANVILNQFREIPNHVVHREVTGRAIERVYRHLKDQRPALGMAAFVSATGSAGTLGAGDYLKERLGARIVAVEALECPTLLRNGYGSHQIQGIGDKHVPFIHNVMSTDVVVAVSDRATDALFGVANDPEGAAAIDARGWPAEVRAALPSFGISSFCNVLAAIKTAKALGLGPDDALFTVATDGAALYPSELPRIRERLFGGHIDAGRAEAALARYLDGATIDHVRELGHEDRLRIFHLGYFTWVEQQGVSLAEFDARKSAAWWNELPAQVPEWDAAIGAFNDDVREAAGAVPG